MALALLFAAAKFIVPLDQKLRANDWSPRYAPARSLGLEGKTALIIGYGQIGQRVGRVCRALGMNVIATRRNRVEQDDIAEVHPTSDLPQLLPRAEVAHHHRAVDAGDEGLDRGKRIGRVAARSGAGECGARCDRR